MRFNRLKDVSLNLADKSKRLLFVVLACIFLIIALVGVITPGLPTTEFVLLAAWCAAKGSTRFHHWLMHRSFFGGMIRHWQEEKSIHRKSKLMATFMMTLSITLMVIWVPHPIMVGCISAVMLLSLVWIWTRPEPQTRLAVAPVQTLPDNMSN